MPTYESICRVCGDIHNYYSTVEKRHETPECCGEKTEKLILSAPKGIPDIEPYTSPIDGRPIHSRKDRREDLKRHGCRPYEGREQEEKEARKRALEADKKLDRKIEKTAAEILNSLPPEKKRLLT